MQKDCKEGTCDKLFLDYRGLMALLFEPGLRFRLSLAGAFEKDHDYTDS